MNGAKKFLLLLLVTLPPAGLLAGCAEDRSNLVPQETVAEITADIDEVQDLVSQGECFDADAAAERARNQVESLGPEVDRSLKRSLLDGVTQLQVTVKDNCEEVDSPTAIQAPVDPTGTTDTVPDTGTTEPDSGSTGGGDRRPGNGGDGSGGDNGGNQGPGTNPQPPTEPTNPTDPTQPTEPTEPTKPDTGSGGVGPSSGG